MEEQTYAYETSSNSEELLKIKKEELKVLRKKAARDRTVRLANKSGRRVIRDDKLDKIRLKLNTIKEHMVKYNRAGKVEKDRTDILGVIYNFIKNDVELLDEIERGLDSEVVDESEISLN